MSIDGDPRSDEELVAAAGRGDARAFGVLLNRHRSRLSRVCRGITCHDDDAQEAMQRAMIKSWSSAGGFDGRSSVSTWLHRIVVNASIDEVRRRGRLPEPVEQDTDRAGVTDVEREAATRIDVDRALSHLSPQYRAVVVLHDVGGLACREIADLHGRSVDTVKSQLARGRRALAALLNDDKESE